MDYIDVIILGVVEGVTEFLPVSSTGHLILVSKLLSLPDSEFLKTFEIAIQLGAILAVVVLFGKRLLTTPDLWKRIGVAFLPTGGIGYLFYAVVKEALGSELTVAVALIGGGIILILFERYFPVTEDQAKPLEELTYREAVLLGCFQALALIPGVSRSGATIVGGLLLKLKRAAIVEFSFLLAVPTIMTATGYEIWKQAAGLVGGDIGALLLGGTVSFVVALLAIRFFIRFVQTNTFVPFGIYRIAAGVAFLWWMM